jgi:hypothetical protein
VRDAEQRVEGTEGVGIDAMKRPGDDDFSTGDGVVPPVVLTGGNNPGKDGGGENARRQQRQRMWEAQTTW